MNGFALLLATAVLGVDYGWQPASDGRLEYIIQIEPITLIALREGQEVVSQIDPLARNVRRFRIRVGTDVVPRVGMPVQTAAPAFSAAASAPPPGVTYGWQPVNEQQVELIVQLSPERLAALRNEPITGEIPAELKSVARVRVRSGVANLPRQNVPQVGPPVMAGVPVGGQPVPGNSPRVSGGPEPNGLWHLGSWESASQPAVACRQSHTNSAKRQSGSEHAEQSGGAGRCCRQPSGDEQRERRRQHCGRLAECCRRRTCEPVAVQSAGQSVGQSARRVVGGGSAFDDAHES